jgi:hypothetical protein
MLDPDVHPYRRVLVWAGAAVNRAKRAVVAALGGAVLAVVDVHRPRTSASVRPEPGRKPGGTVALNQPPVPARCDGELPLGERIRVRLVTADPISRKVLFERV